MLTRTSQGTLLRWIWSELEILYPQSYLLGALASPAQQDDTSLSVTITALLPQEPPAALYLDAEQVTLTAVSGITYTVTRGVNGTEKAVHPTGTKVLADSLTAVAKEYAMSHVAFHFGGHALVQCEMMPMQLISAAQDSRLIILPNVTSSVTIPAAVASALSSYGVTAEMTMADLLTKLGETEPQFVLDL